MKAHGAALVAGLLAVALAVSIASPGTAVGGEETIGVSGHWVLEIRNADGTPAGRREFHNEFVGVALLQDVLSGRSVVGPLQIVLGCGQPPCNGPCAGVSCIVVEPRLPVTGSALIQADKTLTATSGSGGLQLRGTQGISNDATITQVITRVATCPPSVATGSCAPNTLTAAALTSAVLSPGIPVVQGQQVLVIVTITAGTAAPAPAAASRAPSQ